VSSPIHTNQRAELYAGLAALRVARRIRIHNPVGRARLNIVACLFEDLRRVVIKADSEYLVRAMTEWTYKWNDNGFTSQRGVPVVNADLFRQLDDVVEDLNGWGVRVQFWHVPRAQNAVADHLARSALDGMTTDEALNEYFGTARPMW